MAKEELSQFLEEKVFKTFTDDGLYVCDIPTGCGKSYNVAKLTCEYFPTVFERTIILCVQTKLVEGVEREINRFVNNKNTLLNPKKILIIENNINVLAKAVRGNHFEDLIDEMANPAKAGNKRSVSSKLLNMYKEVKRLYEDVVKHYNYFKGEDTNMNDQSYGDDQLGESKERALRKGVRSYFACYKSLHKNGAFKGMSDDDINKKIKKDFPSLEKVYPQVNYKDAQVLLMTVHKAMYGIDLIISESVDINNFADGKKKTNIIFDESDQAATSMRQICIGKSIERDTGGMKFERGYDGYRHLNKMLKSRESVFSDYYSEDLLKKIYKADTGSLSYWEKMMGDIPLYNDIILCGEEDIEMYRRGVFFCGDTCRLVLSNEPKKENSYICHRREDKYLTLCHSTDKGDLQKRYGKYDVVVSVEDFLALCRKNIRYIHSAFSDVIEQKLDQNKKKFQETDKSIASDQSPQNYYSGYPTREREIHTFFKRFGLRRDEIDMQQDLMLTFMTNRKNILLRIDGKEEKLLDNTVYFQGVQLYEEEIDKDDNLHGVTFSCREILTTPEKIIYNLASKANTTVVLCSATASCYSVVSNFDITYLRRILGDKYHTLSDDDRKCLYDLMFSTYPKEYNIEAVEIEKYEAQKGSNRIELPEKYRNMFCQDAIDDGYVDGWFGCVKRLLEASRSNESSINYELYLLFQFVEVYKFFYDCKTIHSMLYFQNRVVNADDERLLKVTCCLIDGTYKNYPSITNMDDHRDWDKMPSCKNEHIYTSKHLKEVEDDVLSKLSKDKDAKIMLVAAYNSFKAGTNLQYGIPDGLEYLRGDSWEGTGGPQKDFDAIFLQCPTCYFMLKEGENTYEENLYKAMLTLMMFYERGYIAPNQVIFLLYKAFSVSNGFYFSEQQYPGVLIDKSAWVQSIFEQAVGRLCRTKNKPSTTYILFDKSAVPFFRNIDPHKLKTKEYARLEEKITKLSNDMSINNEDIDPGEAIRCNYANRAKYTYGRVLRRALYYTPKDNEDVIDDIIDVDNSDNDKMSLHVKDAQKQIESFKKTILRKPVIDSKDDLDDNDKRYEPIYMCYGDWPRGVDNKLYYRYMSKEEGGWKMCYGKDGKEGGPVSPSSVRLDVLMRNDVIRHYFEAHGYATSWKQGGLILHPDILATTYAGEIGEEAFRALILHYVDIAEDRFVHPTDRDYEVADFVVLNADGRYKIAFDVKNMNPKSTHYDSPGDIPTRKKRKMKKERLQCEVIIVNMLKMNETSVDAHHEITGLIDDEGRVIMREIERLKTIIEG